MTAPAPLQQFIDLRPAGGFDVIMADPPWSYEMRSEKGYAKAPEAQYETMTPEAIKALPVELLAAQNCLLWLWAVNPQLPLALEVMAAWGFTFKTAGTWVKRSAHGKVSFGTGYILRSANEPFLIGTRGAPKTTRSTRSAVITETLEVADAVQGLAGGDDWPRDMITIEALARGHSRKPDAAYEACEELMPDARRLELFSRQPRAGWAAWGDETGKFGAAP
jgi:N6-adenosine-specific RNA methylase IME4